MIAALRDASTTLPDRVAREVATTAPDGRGGAADAEADAGTEERGGAAGAGAGVADGREGAAGAGAGVGAAVCGGVAEAGCQ